MNITDLKLGNYIYIDGVITKITTLDLLKNEVNGIPFSRCREILLTDWTLKKLGFKKWLRGKGYYLEVPEDIHNSEIKVLLDDISKFDRVRFRIIPDLEEGDSELSMNDINQFSSIHELQNFPLYEFPSRIEFNKLTEV